ncbi:MAG: hypothetical protein ACXQS2_01525 [Methermicoccaceae archaeon]
MTNIEFESKARLSLITLSIISKKLDELIEVIEDLGLEKEEVDEAKEHVEALQSKIKEWIDQLSKFLDGVWREQEAFIDKEKIEKYARELEKYVEFSNKILQTVLASVNITPYMFKAGDSIVVDVADVEELIRLAVYRTIDVMIKG